MSKDVEIELVRRGIAFHRHSWNYAEEWRPDLVLNIRVGLDRCVKLLESEGERHAAQQAEHEPEE